MHLLDLQRIAMSEPHLAGVRFIRHLPGGPVSQSWLVDLNGQQAVLRHDKELARLLGLDRNRELEVLYSVAAAGFGPRVLWARPEVGLLLTGWVDGRTWSSDDMQQASQLLRLGSRVAVLHSSDISLPIIDLEQAINVYANAAASAGAAMLRREAMSILAGLDLRQDQFSPGHNDLGCHNIVERKGIVFLDWEYGGLVDPLFDLAGIVYQNNLTDAMARVVLEGYAGNIASRGQFWERFSRFRRLYGLVATLWQLVADAAEAGYRSDQSS